MEIEGTTFESFATAVGMVIHTVAKHGVSDPDKLQAALESLIERIESRSEADSDVVAEAAQFICGGIYSVLD